MCRPSCRLTHKIGFYVENGLHCMIFFFTLSKQGQTTLIGIRKLKGYGTKQCAVRLGSTVLWEVVIPLCKVLRVWYSQRTLCLWELWHSVINTTECHNSHKQSPLTRYDIVCIKLLESLLVVWFKIFFDLVWFVKLTDLCSNHKTG